MKIIKVVLAEGIFAILAFQCSTSVQERENDEEYPVLETMGYYQRFTDKLWLAGKNENWELADFYVHELNEVSEKLIAGQVMHDDYNLSNLSEAMMMPKISNVEEAIRKQDQVLFQENYVLMVSACNLCHQATKHAFIKIVTPSDTLRWNQDFSVLD